MSSVPTPSEQRALKTLEAFDPEDKTPLRNIALGGIIVGIALPVAVVNLLPPAFSGRFPTSGDRLMLAVASLPVCSVAFFLHLISGARARGKGEDKAIGTYPAEASIVRAEPVALVRANRAFQNTIENFMIFMPAFLGASLHMQDARNIPAAAITWTAARIVYRAGYLSDNSLNRAAGFLPSLTLSVGLCFFSLYKYVGIIRR